MDTNQPPSFVVTGPVADLFAALSAAQGGIGAITRDRQNDQLRNRYATLNAIRESAAPVLAANGLALVQWHEVSEGPLTVVTDKSGSYEAAGGVVVTHSLLVHASGASLKVGPLAIPWLHTRGINRAQAIGIAQTYGARYATTNLLAIAATDAEDTDAEHPVRAAPVAVEKKDRPLPSSTAPAVVSEFVRDFGTDMAWLKFLAVRAHKAFPEGHAAHDVWFTALSARKETLLAEAERVADKVNGSAPEAPPEPGSAG